MFRLSIVLEKKEQSMILQKIDGEVAFIHFFSWSTD